MYSQLPRYLLTCQQTRALDQCAISNFSLPGTLLMKRAARAAFELALSLWPENRNWIVVCGSGNNAGDGYAFAAIAKEKGHNVKLLALKEPSQLSGEARQAWRYAQQESVGIGAFDPATQIPSDWVIVDALLGSGVRGQVKDDFQVAIDWMNGQPCAVLALDLPSGLCADTGVELGSSVKATATITFVGCKRGLLTSSGPACTGSLYFSDLDIPSQAFDAVINGDHHVVTRVDRTVCKDLPRKPRDAHKGVSGHLMVVGGDLGYGGAAILAAESAAFSGCGMVSVATRAEHVPAALMRRPELMVRGVPSGQELEPLLERPNVLVVGPGLGQTPWSEQMLQQCICTHKPLVLDADALNILARGGIPWPQQSQCVITPHPGEAGRLLKLSTAEVQQDRFAAVEKLHAQYGGIVVLKGAGTIIYDGRTTYLANVGNAGLATAGSGDVLSGVIGALIAQGMQPIDAALLAVCVHGDAADLLVEEVGEFGMQASELIPYVRELLRP